MRSRHRELCRRRAEGGQTEAVVGDELPAPFAAFAGPGEDLFGEASGFLVATGSAPLLVDVEFGPDRKLYALSQGDWDGVFPGSPAMPETGALVKVEWDGTFTAIVEGLDRPTSLEFIGKTAYVVTLAGEIWKINDVWR